MSHLSVSVARRLGLIESDKSDKAKKRRTQIVEAPDRRPIRLAPLDFEVKGRPVPKQSFRSLDGGQQGYTQRRIIAYANEVAHEAKTSMGQHQPWVCPLELEILVEVAVPKSWSRADREDALAGLIAPTHRPDLDNLAKNAIDAMTGIVSRDDAQFVKKTIEKYYAAQFRILVRVAPRRQRPSYPLESRKRPLVDAI